MLEMEERIGISLFPWEKHIFPEENVVPSLGLGIHPDDSNFKITLYTYSTPGCVFLVENVCQIYSKRPLICRSYPFRITRRGDENIYIIAPECTAAQDWPDKKTIMKRYYEMDAAELIGDHLSRFYKASEPKWRFNQKDGWSPIGTIKTSD